MAILSTYTDDTATTANDKYLTVDSSGSTKLTPASTLKTYTSDSPTFTGTITAPNGSASSKILTNPYSFSAYRASTQTPTANTWTKVNFDTKIFDPNTGFDTTNHRYVAQVPGKHFLTARQSSTNPNGAFLLALYKNGSIWKRGGNVSAAVADGSEVSGLLQLALSDYIEIYVFSFAANALEGTTIEYGTFDGFFVGA